MPRPVPWVLPLLLAVGGCATGENLRTVSGGMFGWMSPKPKPPDATQAVARRVWDLGERIVSANPQMKLHPKFIGVGVAAPTVFHEGTEQVFVSEGLVNECKNEDELAAVLCMELGKMASEQAALGGPDAGGLNPNPPPSLPVGNDSAGPYGAGDGTRYAELVKFEQSHPRGRGPLTPPPPPDAFARGYLQNVGVNPKSLDAVAPLLRKAEDNVALEKQLTNK